MLCQIGASDAVGRIVARFNPFSIEGYIGAHAHTVFGGGRKWGQCLGESVRDAVLGTTGAWTGPTILSAAFDIVDTGCTTNGTCIKVTFSYGGNDSGITIAGGVTAASGNGPSACVVGTVYTDLEINAICLSAISTHSFTARSPGATCGVGDLWSGNYPSNTINPSGYIYQVQMAGTASST